MWIECIGVGFLTGAGTTVITRNDVPLVLQRLRVVDEKLRGSHCVLILESPSAGMLIRYDVSRWHEMEERR